MDLTAELEFTIANLKTDHRLQALVDELLSEIPHTSASQLPPTAVADQWVGHYPPPTAPPPPMTVAPHLWSYPPPPPPPTVLPVSWFEHHNTTVPTMSLPANVFTNMVPVGVINGELVYGLSPGVCTTYSPPAAAATVSPAPLNRPGPQTSRHKRQKEEDGRPYIKKPPNAFLLFLRDQREHVAAELGVRDNAVVNAELGRRWTSLKPQEKDTYFQEAESLRRLHEQSFPGWSTSDNYGRKRRRIRRRKSPTMVMKGEGHTQQYEYLFPSHLHLQTPTTYTTPLPPLL